VRLFAAVFPPPEALEPLHDVVRRWQPEQPQLTWVAPELWHITLAFYGEVAECDVEAHCDRVAAAVLGRREVELQLLGGGAFPDRRDPRVLWAGISGDVPRLAELARAMAVDERPFHPHLTLARVRRRRVAAASLLAALDAVDGPRFRADRVVLMHSSATGGAPRHYTPLTTFTLSGA
jgi:2'-5' RNA ligase